MTKVDKFHKGRCCNGKEEWYEEGKQPGADRIALTEDEHKKNSNFV